MNKQCGFCLVLLGGFENLLFVHFLDAEYCICNDYAFLAKKGVNYK